MRALPHVRKRQDLVPKSSKSRISCPRLALGRNPVQYQLGGEGEPAGINAAVIVAGGEDLEVQDHLGWRRNRVSMVLCLFLYVECVGAWEERLG